MSYSKPRKEVVPFQNERLSRVKELAVNVASTFTLAFLNKNTSPPLSKETVLNIFLDFYAAIYEELTKSSPNDNFEPDETYYNNR